MDSKNPARGPLLIIGGEKDHTVPPAVTNASYKIQSKNNVGITGKSRSPAVDTR